MGTKTKRRATKPCQSVLGVMKDPLPIGEPGLPKVAVLGHPTLTWTSSVTQSARQARRVRIKRHERSAPNSPIKKTNKMMSMEPYGHIRKF